MGEEAKAVNRQSDWDCADRTFGKKETVLKGIESFPNNRVIQMFT
ncbi:hypothetical protein [Bacillus swezeyi]|nr:hypothetical protein [Bacillus swezeyi]